MAKKQIIILGGGYAGIASAKKLYKMFKKDHSVDIFPSLPILFLLSVIVR